MLQAAPWQEIAMTPATQPAAQPSRPPLQLDFGGEPVAVHHEDEVSAYLAKYPELVAQLPKIAVVARKHFGPSAEFLFGMNHDPEIYDPFLRFVVRLPNRKTGDYEVLDAVRDDLEPLADLSEGEVCVMVDHFPAGSTRGI
jgi:hypothetical protein